MSNNVQFSTQFNRFDDEDRREIGRIFGHRSASRFARHQRGTLPSADPAPKLDSVKLDTERLTFSLRSSLPSHNT